MTGAMRCIQHPGDSTVCRFFWVHTLGHRTCEAIDWCDWLFRGRHRPYAFHSCNDPWIVCCCWGSTTSFPSSYEKSLTLNSGPQGRSQVWSIFSFLVACVVGHGVLRHDLYHTVGRMLGGLMVQYRKLTKLVSRENIKPDGQKFVDQKQFLLCLWDL